MPQVQQVPSAKRRLVTGLSIAAIAVVVAGLVVAGIMAYVQWRNARLKAEHVALLSQVSKDYATAQYTAAEAVLTAYLQKNIPTGYRYDTTLQLAATELNLKQPAKALTDYLAAEKVMPTGATEGQASVYYHIAYLSDQAGNKARAITYYQKTIAAARRDYDPLNDLEIPTYQARISELQP